MVNDQNGNKERLTPSGQKIGDLFSDESGKKLGQAGTGIITGIRDMPGMAATKAAEDAYITRLENIADKPNVGSFMTSRGKSQRVLDAEEIARSASEAARAAKRAEARSIQAQKLRDRFSDPNNPFAASAEDLFRNRFETAEEAEARVASDEQAGIAAYDPRFLSAASDFFSTNRRTGQGTQVGDAGTVRLLEQLGLSPDKGRLPDRDPVTIYRNAYTSALKRYKTLTGITDVDLMSDPDEQQAANDYARNFAKQTLLRQGQGLYGAGLGDITEDPDSFAAYMNELLNLQFQPKDPLAVEGDPMINEFVNTLKAQGLIDSVDDINTETLQKLADIGAGLSTPSNRGWFTPDMGGG